MWSMKNKNLEMDDYMEHLAYCDKKSKELENLIAGYKTMLIGLVLFEQIAFGGAFGTGVGVVIGAILDGNKKENPIPN